jgi:hypothetical protein
MLSFGSLSISSDCFIGIQSLPLKRPGAAQPIAAVGCLGQVLLNAPPCVLAPDLRGKSSSNSRTSASFSSSITLGIAIGRGRGRDQFGRYAIPGRIDRHSELGCQSRWAITAALGKAALGKAALGKAALGNQSRKRTFFRANFAAYSAPLYASGPFYLRKSFDNLCARRLGGVEAAPSLGPCRSRPWAPRENDRVGRRWSADLIEREERLRALAHKLLFRVERSGKRRFTLTRTADVSMPARHEALTPTGRVEKRTSPSAASISAKGQNATRRPNHCVALACIR